MKFKGIVIPPSPTWRKDLLDSLFANGVISNELSRRLDEYLDVFDEKLVFKVIEDIEPDVVVHYAAIMIGMETKMSLRWVEGNKA